MKLLIKIVTIVAVVALSATAAAQKKNRLLVAKYQPVVQFLDIDTTLGQWFKQYVDTTSGSPSFKDFLNRLSDSEVLLHRSTRAGLSHNQLYSPVVTLLETKWSDIANMSDQDIASVRLAMVELDIALAAIEATFPSTAYEEFRREVIRGAKPLTEVAKLPMPAVEAMTFTIMTHKVSDRINNPTVRKTPEESPSQIVKPIETQSIFRLW